MAFDILNFTRTDILGLFGLQQYTGLFIFELMDMLIMAIAIGYIFSGYLKPPVEDVISYYKKKSTTWHDIRFAALVAGTAVVLHELSHKFVAMAFGASATLYAPYGFYIIVSILKAVGFPLLFFVGGFVAHTPLPALQSALVSLAGPLMNFLIWAVITILVSQHKLSRKQMNIAYPLARISLFLAIFNMIPIPGFDGWGFFSNLIGAFR